MRPAARISPEGARLGVHLALLIVLGSTESVRGQVVLNDPPPPKVTITLQ